MRTALTFLTLLLSLGLCLTGCSFLTPRQDLTPEQQAAAIKSLARTGTFIALTEISEGDTQELRERAEALKLPIERDVLPLLRDGSVTFDETTIGLLEAKIDRRYAIYIQQAIDLLKLYYEVPDVGGVMSPESLLLWEALFEGILDGADAALLTAEEQASIFIDPDYVKPVGVYVDLYDVMTETPVRSER